MSSEKVVMYKNTKGQSRSMSPRFRYINEKGQKVRLETSCI